MVYYSINGCSQPKYHKNADLHKHLTTEWGVEKRLIRRKMYSLFRIIRNNPLARRISELRIDVYNAVLCCAMLLVCACICVCVLFRRFFLARPLAHTLFRFGNSLYVCANFYSHQSVYTLIYCFFALVSPLWQMHSRKRQQAPINRYLHSNGKPNRNKNKSDWQFDSMHLQSSVFLLSLSFFIISRKLAKINKFKTFSLIEWVWFELQSIEEKKMLHQRIFIEIEQKLLTANIVSAWWSLLIFVFKTRRICICAFKLVRTNETTKKNCHPDPQSHTHTAQHMLTHYIQIHRVLLDFFISLVLLSLFNMRLHMCEIIIIFLFVCLFHSPLKIWLSIDSHLYK